MESRKESKVPQLSDLRESGAIEQDADMVMFLYRPEYYGVENNEMGETIEGETHIHIAKNRSGSTATIKLQFIKEYQKFVDLPDTSFGNFRPMNDNPQAGMRRDTSGFGDSKLYIPGGFQTMPSKANKVNWDEENGPTGPNEGKGLGNTFNMDPMDEEAPF